MIAKAKSRGACALLCLTVASSGCGSGEPKAEATEAICNVIAPTECSQPALRYADVAPVFRTRCASCHLDAPGAPWPLDEYQPIADWADVVRDELLRCSMPPADSGVSLPHSERDAILAWLRCGYPE